MILLVVKVSSWSPMLHMTLLLLHVHIVHSVLFTTSETLLTRVSPVWTHQPLLLLVVVIVVWRHVRRIHPLLLRMHTSHHWFSVSNMVRLWMGRMLSVELRMMLHVMIVSSHWMVVRSWMMNHVRRTKRSHRRCIRSRRWRPLLQWSLVMLMVNRHHSTRTHRYVLSKFLFGYLVRIARGWNRSSFHVGRCCRRWSRNHTATCFASCMWSYDRTCRKAVDIVVIPGSVGHCSTIDERK